MPGEAPRAETEQTAPRCFWLTAVQVLTWAYLPGRAGDRWGSWGAGAAGGLGGCPPGPWGGRLTCTDPPSSGQSLGGGRKCPSAASCHPWTQRRQPGGSLVAFTPRPGRVGAGLQEGQRLQGGVCVRSVGGSGGCPLAQTVISTSFFLWSLISTEVPCVWGQVAEPARGSGPHLGHLNLSRPQAAQPPGPRWPSPQPPAALAPQPPAPWLPCSPAPRSPAARLAGLWQGAQPAGPRAWLCSAWEARAHGSPVPSVVCPLGPLCLPPAIVSTSALRPASACPVCACDRITC